MEPEESPGYLMWRATLRWQRRITATLAPFSLTHVQFVLLASLWWLDREGVRPNQLALAQQADTDVKMTSQVVRRLEDKGLLVRETDAADTRAKLLRITDEGRSLAEAAISAVEAADVAFFADAPDRETVLATLRPLAGQRDRPGA